ncbi:hypothetical protein B0H34DRAFT_857928 [Crassisporium funariophilum]|nr:hypothetical protein B0H34DRAFT_857928 [Crassisporium funariophilum]
MPPVNTPLEQGQQQPISSLSIQAISGIVYYHDRNSFGALLHGRNEAHVDADNESIDSSMSGAFTPNTSDTNLVRSSSAITNLIQESFRGATLLGPNSSNTLNTSSTGFSSSIATWVQPSAALVQALSHYTAVPPLRPFFQDTIAMQIVGAPLSFVAPVNWSHNWGDHGPSGRYSIPGDMNLDDCVSNDDWVSLPPKGNPYHSPAGFPYSSQVTFDLPVSCEALLLVSRGSTSAGSVDVVTSTEQPHDVATVRVVVNYFRDNIRDEAKVGRISRQEGETGVGIFTPEWRRGHRGVEETLYFETTVVLPESSTSLVPLVINKFETDVPNTLQRVHDLGKKILFRHILLKGKNAAIEVKSLGMENGEITSSNGPIHGMFNTSNTLVLMTSNAPIRADVGLENNAGFNAKVALQTSNSPIESNISLLSSKGSGGVFDVSASTSNSRLHVNFPAAPMDSTLRFTGRTSNAPATAFLNPSYEGSFNLQTSRLGAVVNDHKGVEDPSGKKRKRIVQSTQQGGDSLLGSVYWADDGGPLKLQGEVILTTYHARVALVL